MDLQKEIRTNYLALVGGNKTTHIRNLFSAQPHQWQAEMFRHLQGHPHDQLEMLLHLSGGEMKPLVGQTIQRE
jgi:hypothetical protein